MTELRLLELAESQFELCKDLLRKKGADYSDGGDTLSHFKIQAKLQDIDPKLVWAVLFTKQILAILKWAHGRELESETIENRFADTINFLFLGLALLEDGRDEEDQPEVQEYYYGNDEKTAKDSSLSDLFKEKQKRQDESN